MARTGWWWWCWDVGRVQLSHVSALSVSDVSPAICQSAWMAIHPLSPPTHAPTPAFDALTWKCQKSYGGQPLLRNFDSELIGTRLSWGVVAPSAHCGFVLILYS